MDVERGRTVKGWRPRRLGEHILPMWGSQGSCVWWFNSHLFLLKNTSYAPSAAFCLLFLLPHCCSHPPSLSSLSSFIIILLVPSSHSELPSRSRSTGLKRPVWDQKPACCFLAGGFPILPCFLHTRNQESQLIELSIRCPARLVACGGHCKCHSSAYTLLLLVCSFCSLIQQTPV